MAGAGRRPRGVPVSGAQRGGDGRIVARARGEGDKVGGRLHLQRARDAASPFLERMRRQDGGRSPRGRATERAADPASRNPPLATEYVVLGYAASRLTQPTWVAAGS